jgi:hypothetical protein
MLVPAGFNRNPSFPLGYAKVPVTVPVVYVMINTFRDFGQFLAKMAVFSSKTYMLTKILQKYNSTYVCSLSEKRQFLCRKYFKTHDIGPRGIGVTFFVVNFSVHDCQTFLTYI